MREGAARRQWVYLALGCWSVIWFAILARRGGIAWKFFTTGTSLLFGGHPAVIPGVTGPESGHGGPVLPGGLHIFASYPALQIGPLGYIASALLYPLGPDHGLVAAEVLLQCAGLLIVWLVERIAVTVRPALAADRRLTLTMLTGGAVFIVAWSELAAGFAHLDDGLALLLAVLAVRGATSGHPVLAGLCTGLAVDAKPWALVFLPILLIAAGARARVLAAGAAAAVIAAAWLPFFLADSGTMNATRFLIRNQPSSALRALGVTENYTPSWDRQAQVLVGCALGAAAVWRRRWAAVLLLAGGARILLDPATHSYYTPDIMTGALLWDVLGPRRPLPLWSLASFAALNLTPLLTHSAPVQGAIRLALIAAFTATILLPGPLGRTLGGDGVAAAPDAAGG